MFHLYTCSFKIGAKRVRCLNFDFIHHLESKSTKCFYCFKQIIQKHEINDGMSITLMILQMS